MASQRNELATHLNWEHRRPEETDSPFTPAKLRQTKLDEMFRLHHEDHFTNQRYLEHHEDER